MVTVNRTLGAWGSLFAAVAILFPAVMRADVAIYQSTVGLDSNLFGTNYVPFVDDPTPNRPTGAWIGNTITFDASLWTSNQLLTSVDLATANDVGNGVVFTLDVFSGSDPNSGTLLASSTATVGHSQSEATFLFNVLVPQTVTFVVSSDHPGTFPASTGATNADGTPQVGSADNSLWFGDPTVASSFTSNSAWALADGASTDYLGAEFFAGPTVPEPSAVILLGSIVAFLGIGTIVRKRRAEKLVSTRAT